jgi:hypothetical protein
MYRIEGAWDGRVIILIRSVPGTRKPPLLFYSAWHERERTPKRPDGKAVPPKPGVNAGSSERPLLSLRWGMNQFLCL